MNNQQYNFIISIVAATIFFLMLAGFVIIFILLYKKKRLQHQNEKMLLKSQFEHTLLQTQIEIQEHTLNDISIEIHDNIGQILSTANLTLDAFPDDLEEPLQKKLEETELLVSKAMHALRNLSQSMNTDKIASIGFREALQQLLTQLQKTGRYKTRLQVGGDQYSLEPQKELVLFRIVQETVNNSIKHAGAKNIDIELLYRPGSLIMQVSDDGIGFNMDKNPESKPGIGLQNMRKRATLIGAKFSVHSYPDRGTSINIELPTALP